MSKDVTQALATSLQELRLPAVRAQYEAVARQASAETWSYPEYLLELLQRECQQRQHKQASSGQTSHEFQSRQCVRMQWAGCPCYEGPNGRHSHYRRVGVARLRATGHVRRPARRPSRS